MTVNLIACFTNEHPPFRLLSLTGGFPNKEDI